MMSRRLPRLLDWLRRAPAELPTITIGDQCLPVMIRRTASARRMTMRLAPDGSEVRITLPRWGRTAEALDFAEAKADWLAAQLDRIAPRLEVQHGTLLPYLGASLTVDHDSTRSRRIVITDEQLVVGGPANGLDGRIRRWLEGEARRLLNDDLAHYCDKAGQPPQRLLLSRAQRRWGSCAHDGTIRINWRLVMAPTHVRRSVVAHEVAHLTHFDHSPRFHAHLADLFEHDIATANAWLRQHGRGLYALFG